MEPGGPRSGRAVMGPWRRLSWAGEVARPAARRRFWRYALPLALLALIGLAFAADAYLMGNRKLPAVALGLAGAGSVLPAVVAWRRPILAWRLAFLMLFLGAVNAGPKEPWP